MSHRSKSTAPKLSRPRPRKPSPSDSEFVAPWEVAAYLGVSERTINRLFHSGALNFIKVTGECIRVRRSALAEFIARREVRA